jgi:hypothetical protein
MNISKSFNFSDQFKIDYHLVQAAEMATKFTPDVALLEERSHWRVFVCDRHMSDLDNALDAKRHGFAFTNDGFKLYRRNLGKDSNAVPFVQELYETNPDWNKGQGLVRVGDVARIKGEIFIASTEKLKELDRVYCNGVQYQRVRVSVLVPYHETEWYPEYYKAPVELQKMFNHRRIILRSEKRFYNVTAWMYVGVPTYWDDFPHYMLKYVDVYRARNERVGWYYHFTKKDYEFVESS